MALSRKVPPILVFLLVSLAALAQSRVAPDAEQDIVRLVNRERQARGLATLVVDERLVEAARKHSDIMARTGEVEHQIGKEPKLTQRLSVTAIRYDASGENVALAANAARAHDALMHSPGHRANILDPQYNAIGIGVIRTPQGIYVTEDFARRLPEASVGQAEEQIAQTFNRLRRSAGYPMLNRVAAPGLRKQACEMASNNKLNPRAGLSLPNVSNAVTFTATDLNQIPQSLERLKSRPASGFSVGACYQASASYENPVFWIVVVTYF